MARTFIVAILLFGLPGCSTLPDWGLFDSAADGTKKESGSYDFAWRLSGSRAVAPVQVFDNGRRMWLQFAASQALPAIFLRSSHGERPLSYRREGPYVVLQGVWPHLVLRGGRLESFIDRADPIPAGSAPQGSSTITPAVGNSLAVSFSTPDTFHPVEGAGPSVADKATLPPRPPATKLVRAKSASSAPSASSIPVIAPARSRLVASKGSVLPASVPLPRAAVPANQQKDSGTPLVPIRPAAALTAGSFVAAAALKQSGQLVADQTGVYEVGPADGNIRSALARWAQAAGWTFKAEHWAVDADIPIVGSARFDSGFQLAVQDLVASTELADRPLQPCFYSNKVLRIVPYAQSCDRTAGVAQPS